MWTSWRAMSKYGKLRGFCLETWRIWWIFPKNKLLGLSHPPFFFFFLSSVLPSGKFLKKRNQSLETCYRNLAIFILIFQHMVNFKDHFYHRNKSFACVKITF